AEFVNNVILFEDMPSPERPEVQNLPEPGPPPYYRASRFSSEELSSAAYEQIRKAVFRDRRLDLSVFRILLDAAAHVAVLGAAPPDRLERRLERVLARGEQVSLPADVLEVLWQRREEARQKGYWVERR